MTGVNYSKKLRKILKNHKSGQVLLITIMLIGVVLTVVLSITFTSRTETQLTKLEEENQKALAAAEAGIEAALKSGIVGSPIDLKTLNQDFTGTATISNASGTSFISPYLADGQQYTFYLSNYPDFSSPFAGNLNIRYGSASGQDCGTVDLEIVIINGASPYTRTPYKANVSGSWGGAGNIGQTTSNTLDGVNFACRTSNFAAPANSLFMLVRVIGAGTKLGFNSTGGSFNIQGKYVTSTASSPTGVTKKVQLFQSYPQIPSDFYVTSF